jgi:hypothetical protein
VVRKAVQAYAPGETAPPADPTERQLEEGDLVFLTGRIARGHLTRRLTALRRLREHWQASHLPLLQLFNPEPRGWGEAQMVNQGDQDADWRLLTGASPLTTTARAFVRKAIGTTDFTLLEAAAGPARRTAVLELILQAIARGQRLLVVAADATELDEMLAAGAALPGWAEQVAAVRLTDPCEPTAPAAQAFDLDRQAALLTGAAGGRFHAPARHLQPRRPAPLGARRASLLPRGGPHAGPGGLRPVDRAGSRTTGLRRFPGGRGACAPLDLGQRLERADHRHRPR